MRFLWLGAIAACGTRLHAQAFAIATLLGEAWVSGKVCRGAVLNGAEGCCRGGSWDSSHNGFFAFATGLGARHWLIV